MLLQHLNNILRRRRMPPLLLLMRLLMRRSEFFVEIVEAIPVACRPCMERYDFICFGYIGGCLGCVHLQAGLSGSRNPNEVCKTRIKKCLEKTPEGRARKDRAIQRREDQLTRELER